MSSQKAIPFAFPPALNASFYCSISSSAFGVVSVLDFGHSNHCVLVSRCFNCSSSMTCDVEHLFICIFAICISSLVRCPFRSLPIFFFSFTAAPAAYGSSQTKGQIGLHHSHSTTGSKLHCELCHSLQQRQILNPLSKTRDRTCIYMDIMLGS